MSNPNFWWLLAGVTIAIELATGTFYLLMISLGMVAAALVAYVGVPLTAQVLTAAGSEPSAQFFARLYIGLYLEATGNREGGRAQIEMAAEDRYARVGGYMHDVARVHMKRP